MCDRCQTGGPEGWPGILRAMFAEKLLGKTGVVWRGETGEGCEIVAVYLSGDHLAAVVVVDGTELIDVVLGAPRDEASETPWLELSELAAA